MNVNLNGKVSVETSGTGTAAIASGDSLQMLGAWAERARWLSIPATMREP
ncbi:MAG: hypothetical protein ACLT8E_04850 [Akkermansia sp.]